MENLSHNFNAEQSQVDGETKLDEAISKESDRLLTSLESSEISNQDMGKLLESLAVNDPKFQEHLNNFQDVTSNKIGSMLLARKTPESLECTQEDAQISEYFGIENNDFIQLQEQLSSVGLQGSILLKSYQNTIEQNLDGLGSELQEKVKLAISIKFGKLGGTIQDVINNIPEGEEPTNSRWIVNARIVEEFSFINNELLPSLEAYSKIKAGAEVPEKYTMNVLPGRDYTNVSQYNIPNKSYHNPDFVSVDHKLQEIEELIGASVNEDGEFDEGFWFTQQIFDINNPAESRLMGDLGIESIDISLLNEKDKEIESEATLYFMAAIAVQIGVETVGALPGMILGGSVDMVDIFNDEETLLNIVQDAELVDKGFKMDKTLVDKVLAGAGLLPYGTQLIKGTKLAKYLKNVDPKVFKNAMNKIKEKLGIKNKVNKIDEKYDYRGIDDTYSSPISSIKQYILEGDIEKAKELMQVNSKKIYFPGGTYNDFRSALKLNQAETALTIFKKAELKTIEKLENIGFTIEENLQFYIALKTGNIKDITRLLGISREKVGDVINSSINHTSEKYGITWNKITDIEKYKRKEEMVNPFTNKEEIMSREEFHGLIINSFLELVKREDNPTFYVIGGIAGSGKSETKKATTVHLGNYIEIDPDAIRKLLPEFKDNIPETALNTHVEASYIADKILEGSYKNNGNIVRENTLTWEPSVIEYIEKSKETHTMDIRFVFSGEEAWIRNSLSRDRTVNPQIFITQFKAFETIIGLAENPLAKNIKIYSNTQDSTIIFEKIDSKVVNVKPEMKRLLDFYNISKQLNN